MEKSHLPTEAEIIVMKNIMTAISDTLDDTGMPLPVKISLLGSMVVTSIADRSAEDHLAAKQAAQRQADFLHQLAQTDTHEELLALLYLQQQKIAGKQDS